jgi:hypothetical protein
MLPKNPIRGVKVEPQPTVHAPSTEPATTTGTKVESAPSVAQQVSHHGDRYEADRSQNPFTEQKGQPSFGVGDVGRLVSSGFKILGNFLMMNSVSSQRSFSKAPISLRDLIEQSRLSQPAELLGTGIPPTLEWEARPAVADGEYRQRFIEHVIDRLEPRLLLASIGEDMIEMPKSGRIRRLSKNDLDQSVTRFGGGTVSPSDEIRLLSEFNNSTTAGSMPSLAELQSAVQLHFSNTRYSNVAQSELNSHINSLLTDIQTASLAVT